LSAQRQRYAGVESKNTTTTSSRSSSIIASIISMARQSPRRQQQQQHSTNHLHLTPLNTKFVVGNGDFPSLELSSGSDNEGPSDEEKDDVEEDWSPQHRYQQQNAAVRLLRRNSSGSIPPPPPPPPPPTNHHAAATRGGGHPQHQHQRQHRGLPQQQQKPQQSQPSVRYNRIQLHIYDLIASDTLMQLPWGCICEIGKCFNDVNSALHELGTGAYHVGVDVNGVEYAFGATSVPGKSGVFSCIPKLSPGYQYRTSISFGNVPLIRTSYIKTTATTARDRVGDSTNKKNKKATTTLPAATQLRRIDEYVDGKVVIKEMATEYMGADYNILRRNCCTFAYEACVRLGIPADQIPSWFRNLAETGAYSQDIANSTIVEPLKRVLSSTTPSPNDVFSFFADDNNSVLLMDDNHHKDARSMDKEGFEMIARRNETNTRDVVVVLRSVPPPPPPPAPSSRLHRRRSTASAF
jgi:PPPDE putative peptidase domain